MLLDGVTDPLRNALLIFLVIIGALVGVLLFLVVLQRGVRAFHLARTDLIERRYAGAIDALFRDAGRWSGAAVVMRAPARHRRIVARMLVRPLRVLSGESVTRARDAAGLVGLTSVWTHDLHARRWWRRAEAALALGFIRDAAVQRDLIVLLEDRHDEVRSAAIEALGRLGDVRAVPALLDRLSDQSRHQRARIIDAITMIGPSGGPVLLEHARRHPEQLPILTGLLPSIGGSAAVPDLLQWTASATAAIRTAAFDALGAIGLDDRSFYHALRGLRDSDDHVRAMAARALGRSGRDDAAPYLAACLDDGWVVSTQAAKALSLLGEAGVRYLTERAGGGGEAADRASQVLWEHAREPS